MRVFIDASVLVAAYLSPTGGSARLLGIESLARVTSATAIDEVRSSLNRHGYDTSGLDAYISDRHIIVRDHVQMSEVKEYVDQIDPEDAHLIAGALSTRCTHLVSLDKRHVLAPHIRTHFASRLTILTPGELLPHLTT